MPDDGPMTDGEFWAVLERLSPEEQGKAILDFVLYGSCYIDVKRGKVVPKEEIAK